jgi:predicted DNA-binding transcriptional regulator YafY
VAKIDRVERLTTLLANLLDTSRALPVEEILERVPGYPPDTKSARRQFERDKELLRRIGVPVTVTPLDPLDDNLVGYRVRKDDYYLPDLDLTDDERVALHAAVSAVDLEGGKARDALLKLGGGEGDAAPRLAALEWAPELPALIEANRDRATATFTYRGKTRTLNPYSVLSRSGHWYVIGFDHASAEARSFRVDRIEGGVKVGAPASFEPPASFNALEVLGSEPWRYGDEEVVDAEVLVDAERAAWVGTQFGEDRAERRPDGSVVLRMKVTNREAFRSFVLGFLDHAEVLGPPRLRAEIIDWLEAIANGAPPNVVDAS